MNRIRAFGKRMVVVAILMLLAGCTLPGLPDAGKISVGRWAEHPYVFTDTCWRIGQATYRRHYLYRQLVRLSKETGKRVFLDSWFYEIHYVVYEDGAWRIRGHAGEDTRALPFGTSPHPFF
ncbi:MAG: hypothetical protein HY038_04540 [Nitrospirae bacterium]|nr:hypothetical protein [Nitrospirota bacterium]